MRFFVKILLQILLLIFVCPLQQMKSPTLHPFAGRALLLRRLGSQRKSLSSK